MWTSRVSTGRAISHEQNTCKMYSGVNNLHLNGGKYQVGYDVIICLVLIEIHQWTKFVETNVTTYQYICKVMYF